MRHQKNDAMKRERSEKISRILFMFSGEFGIEKTNMTIFVSSETKDF
jgi:hypothetical protein